VVHQSRTKWPRPLRDPTASLATCLSPHILSVIYWERSWHSEQKWSPSHTKIFRHINVHTHTHILSWSFHKPWGTSNVSWPLTSDTGLDSQISSHPAGFLLRKWFGKDLHQNTHLLANSRETLLQSFLLYQRTLDTVHDDIHHLKKRSDKLKWLLYFDSRQCLCYCAAFHNKYNMWNVMFLLQPVDRQHLRASSLSGSRSLAVTPS